MGGCKHIGDKCSQKNFGNICIALENLYYKKCYTWRGILCLDFYKNVLQDARKSISEIDEAKQNKRNLAMAIPDWWRDKFY